MAEHDSGTLNETVHIENGERVWPCWCGTHRGEYAAIAYGEHHCSHNDPLLNIGDGQLICTACGKSFYVE